MRKEILFTVTRKDCEWSYYNGTGNGGQAKNKTRSAVRVLHPPSGARGQAQESRSKLDNEKLAFERMAKTIEFQKWARLQAAKITGKLEEIEEKIDYELKHNIKTEVFKNGKWIDWDNSLEKEIDDNDQFKST